MLLNLNNDCMTKIVTFLPALEIARFPTICEKYKKFNKKNQYIINFAYQNIVNKYYNYDTSLILNIPINDNRWQKIIILHLYNDCELLILLLIGNIKKLEKNIFNQSNMLLFSYIYQCIYNLSVQDLSDDTDENGINDRIFNIFKNSIVNFLKTSHSDEIKLKYTRFLSSIFRYLNKRYLLYKYQDGDITYQTMLEYGLRLYNLQ